MKHPLRIQRHDNSYGIIDANERPICYVYYENEPSRRDLMNMMDSSEAEIIVKKIARALSADESLPIRSFGTQKDPPTPKG